MRILIATPAPPGSRRGNRVTAERWATLLEELGHGVVLCGGDALPAQADAELLIALHARAAHGALMEFRRRFPARPTIVALAGTDLYVDGAADPRVAQSLAAAQGIVMLQERAREALTPEEAQRAVVIEQSCAGLSRDAAALDSLVPTPTAGDLLLVGHLRPVKDPFLALEALEALEKAEGSEAMERSNSRTPLRLVHLGAALDDEMARRAEERSANCSCYQWLGERSREETLLRMAHCHALLLTSKEEGGANAITEGVACGAPIIATDNAGTRGQLGDEHPGLFPVGGVGSLVRLLRRLASDAEFVQELRRATARLAPRVDPARERAAWARLLESL
ncbi:MAG: glycosyl transferase family 1 [Planctomycetes bacterium]|jgi:putative glycosyltransferase (TIGR04348 family)|nr:glycosyl transferase family 1 [Planctomycetota bacterium]HJO26534.1 glycosyltransferase [Planctomycetota bacterium]